MQSKRFRDFIDKLLRENRLPASSVSRSIQSSSDFATLISAGLIERLPASTGGSIQVNDRDRLNAYFVGKFPNSDVGAPTAVTNVKAFRSSKARKRKSQNVVLLRGTTSVLINGIHADLKAFTEQFGAFAAALTGLVVNKLCLVENLDSFLMAERAIGDDFTFLHTYGGLSRSVAEKVNATEILVFPDYDFKGLHNFILVKSIHPTAKLFVPANYEALLQTQSRSIKTRQGREQQASKEVLNSDDELVVKIRADIFKHKKFVEQQAVFA